MGTLGGSSTLRNPDAAYQHHVKHALVVSVLVRLFQRLDASPATGSHHVCIGQMLPHRRPSAPEGVPRGPILWLKACKTLAAPQYGRRARSAFAEELATRFPNSREAAAARDLKRQLRNEVGDSIRDLATSRLEAENYSGARSAAQQVEREFGDTPSARGVSNFLAQVDRREKAAQKERDERQSRQREERARAAADLEILDWRWSTSHGYATAEGRVKNISGRRLENVVAEVTFTDRSGGFITTDDALISLNPILPGQTSTFKVMARQNPAMNNASLSFKFLMGGSIPTYRN